MNRITAESLTGNSAATRGFYAFWLAISVWLLACAYYVQGEYGDGYQTIVNTRYLLGLSDGYYVQRGPLFPLAMLPLEAMRLWLDWSLIDVRPYHAFSALMHSAYLYGCWRFLIREQTRRFPALLAFVAAIVTVTFYGNAAHLSHDLFPGLIFLSMIFLCDQWLERPQLRQAILLIALGTAASLVKQTYAIFWVSLLLYGLLAFLLKWDQQRVTGRKLVTMGMLAAISGAISFVSYSLFISQQLPDTPFLLRPLRLISVVSGQYEDTFAQIFLPDLYIRNLHNYGLAAMLLVVPGLFVAFRSRQPRLRIVAVCWLVCIVVMQVVSFKEVRYLAYLAPLTAILILPVISDLIRQRAALLVLLLVIAADQFRGISMAGEQLRSAASTNVSAFLAAPAGDGRVVSSAGLTFVFLADSPMQRDPYHGIYHMTAELYKSLNLYEFPVVEVADSQNFTSAEVEPGDRVYFANFALLRKRPWQKDNKPAALDELVALSGTAQLVELERQGDTYEWPENDGRFVMYIPDAGVKPQFPMITSGGLPAETVAEMYGLAERPASISVIGVPVDYLCQADKCSPHQAAAEGAH